MRTPTNNSNTGWGNAEILGDKVKPELNKALENRYIFEVSTTAK